MYAVVLLPFGVSLFRWTEPRRAAQNRKQQSVAYWLADNSIAKSAEHNTASQKTSFYAARTLPRIIRLRIRSQIISFG